jgi:hypothetical protein
LVTIEEIANAYGISKAHLTKVVPKLTHKLETVPDAAAACALPGR